MVNNILLVLREILIATHNCPALVGFFTEKIEMNKLNKLVQEKTSFFHNLLLPIYLVSAVLYLAWRVDISRTWNTWYVYPLLIAESYSIAITLLYLITSRQIFHPVWKPPLKNKTVDVLITTYNEPAYIVKMTAIGALQITGVRDVYILDDGNRKEIRAMAKKIGAKYLARQERTHAKAGNMNFGLKHTDAEFLICLDCDHVPQKNFIRRTLGYFRDEKLALVQTPQLFYNTQSIQFRKLHHRNLWNEQSMFYESIQPAKNAFNASFFCGSNAMIRRSAIDSVGGFATGTATDDIHTSLRLHANGWKSLFLRENLAFGLAAEDLEEYHKQRVRWGAGSLGLLFRSADSPFVARGLTIMQRVCYFSSTNYFLNGIQKLFYFILPANIVFSLPFADHNNTTAPILTHLGVFLPFWGFSYLVTYIYSRKTFHPIYTEQFNIANILSNILSLKGIAHVRKKFAVSKKVKTEKKMSVAFTFILVLWALMLLADIFGFYYWFVHLRKTWLDLSSSLAGLALFWNSFNLFFVWSTVRFLWVYNRKPSRKYILAPSDQKLTLMYGRAKSKIVATIFTIGFMGVEVLLKSEIPTRVKKPTLLLGSGKKTIRLPARIVGSTKQPDGRFLLELTFDNLSVKNEIELVTLLFHKLVPGIYRKDVVAKGLGRKTTAKQRGNFGFVGKGFRKKGLEGKEQKFWPAKLAFSRLVNRGTRVYSSLLQNF